MNNSTMTGSLILALIFGLLGIGALAGGEWGSGLTCLVVCVFFAVIGLSPKKQE